MNTYSLFGVDIDGTLISGITSCRITPGLQKALNSHDGSPYTRYQALLARDTVIQFSTKDITALLDKITVDGFAIVTAMTTFFQKDLAYGTRASGTNHLKVVAGSGAIIPLTGHASQGAEGMVDAIVVPISSDGATDPITITGSQALSGSPAVAAKFTLGPGSVNGVDYAIQDLSVQFGINLQKLSNSGLYLPVYANIKTHKPQIRFTTLDVAAALTNIGLDGLAQSATDSVFFFRKLANNAPRTAAASAVHAKFNIDDGHWFCENPGADDEANGTVGVVGDISYDGTNAPIVYSKAAIP